MTYDGLRAAQLAGDLRVVAVLHHAGVDRVALLLGKTCERERRLLLALGQPGDRLSRVIPVMVLTPADAD